MNTENLSKNLGIIAAGLLIVNLALDLYDRFSRKNNENDTTQDSNDEKEDDDES